MIAGSCVHGGALRGDVWQVETRLGPGAVSGAFGISVGEGGHCAYRVTSVAAAKLMRLASSQSGWRIMR